MELLTTRTGRGPGRYKSICQQMHTMKGNIMLHVLLFFMLLASWPGQAAHGAATAPPQNRAPQTVSYIDVGTLYVGGSSATVNASSYFSDPDGDILTYSVNSPSPSIATVSILGSTVTITPVAAGNTSKIIVTARDPGGLTATQDFNVTVQNSPPPPANRAPVAVGYISDVTLQVGGSSATRSVSSKFSDPDGDTLTYSVNSPNPSTVTVSISGSTVTIAPVAAGTTGKIVVTATDPDGETATQDFTATVEAAPPPPPANRAPVAVGSISDVSLNKGGSSATRSVSGKFSDPDNDTLTYSVNSPNPAVVTVTIVGSTVTIAPVATGSTGKIIVTARDPDGETATQDFTATVVNQPPRPVRDINGIRLPKNGLERSVSVAASFTDPNGDALTYSAASSNTSVATASTSGSTVTVRSGTTGTATITVAATDTDKATGTLAFTVVVINRYPQPSGNIPKMSFYRGQDPKSVDVSGNFSDPDNDALTYSASSSMTSVATVSVSGSSVRVTPGGLGAARITVTATDTENARNRHGFEVEVVNRRPVVSQGISAITLNKNSSTSINAADHFYDPDGDQMTFTARSSNTNIVTARASGSTVTIESEDDSEDATVTMTATDAHDDSVSTDFTVTVLNRAPQTKGSIDAVSLYKNRHSQDVIVSSKFTDPDGDAFKYSATSSKTAVATASVSGDTVTITSGNSGSATITVKAEDIDKASATQTISVTVRNRAPDVVSSFEEVNLRVGGPSKSFDVSSNFSDPDGDDLTFSVYNPSPSIAAVSISGSEVAVDPRSEGEIGKVVVTATDSEAAISLDFRVVVGPERTTTPPCPAANPLSAIPIQILVAGGPSVSFDASRYFTNVDGTGINYSIENPDTAIVSVSNSGSMVELTPRRAGDTGKIIVKVKKDECDEVNQDFNVRVDPEPPPPPCPTTNTAAIMVPELCVGGDPAKIDVSVYFTIPRGVTPTYSVNDPSPGTARLSISGHTLTIEPRNQGDTGKVTVTASASECASVTRDFNVTVDPAPPIAECPAVKQIHPNRDLLLTVGENPTSVNLTSHFTNLDKSDVKYSIESSNTHVATASRTDSSLAISPGIVGTAQVTVKVTRCGCGTGASQTFNVRVEPPPPTCPAANLTNPVPDQALTVGGNQKVINLSGHFTNTGGVTYEVSSSNTSVATASNAGASLTIAPGMAGSATVTVTIRKSECPDVEQSFTVNVTEPPPPPTTCPALAGGIPDQTLTVGGDATRIDLTPYFSLPAAFEPDYEVSSTGTSVTTASIQGDTLTLAPVDAGTDTVSVAVGKQDCDTVKQSFVVTVEEGTPPPVAPCPAAITGAPIPDQTLFADAGARRIELTGHFDHIDQQNVEITVTSPSPDIATAAIEGTRLLIGPVTGGRIAAVTVTVADTVRTKNCSPASLSFGITVESLSLYPWKVSGESVYRLGGNVGIGVSSPDRKLVVDGKIRAEEVYVPMTPADYVFEAHHDLMLLEEVARHIGAHGHLPGVASGAHMKANGIGISRMQTLLLEKIEELSLHVISQHEQLRAQGVSIDAQQRRRELQSQRIRQLDHRLERLEQ